jgi:alpha-amylase
MKTVVFYFQVHQPYRMRNYHILEIGKNHNYFDDVQNTTIIKKVAEKCYLPATRMMAQLVRETNGKFRVSYSISGVALEQMQKDAPQVIDAFRDLASTGGVEFLAETYYHSLASVFSQFEFEEQVHRQMALVEKLFNYRPYTFRNTELTYHDHLAWLAQNLGFKTVLTEGVDQLIGRDGACNVFKAKHADVKVLCRNYRLSDDIAFRFSAHRWSEFPLYADKWASWVKHSPGPLCNIFIDYETFGEHHWEETGIFQFLKHLPSALLDSGEIEILTPGEAARKYQPVGEISPPHWISWADTERDLSAWLGNDMQRNAMAKLYELEGPVKTKRDPGLLEDWRRLSTSDHFYYMSTKHAGDAEVHTYFNPHLGPHYAYINMMRILNDVEERAHKN